MESGNGEEEGSWSVCENCFLKKGKKQLKIEVPF